MCPNQMWQPGCHSLDPQLNLAIVNAANLAEPNNQGRAST